MPHHPEVALSGEVTHVFAHRFVLETLDGPVLADLTPHGQERIALKVGDRVALRGERKPSEVKVAEITRDGEVVRVEHDKRYGHGPGHHGPGHQAPADPQIAFRAARGAGYEPVGEPRRKPKHFEVLGRRGGALAELHVELDGRIRKTKPADADDPKWRGAA